jgi:hypothetical protein
MAILFNIRHETGDLTEYTTHNSDGDDLTVATAAALAGTIYGLAVAVEDTGALYGSKTFTAPAAQMRLRLYFDPNSFALTSGQSNAFLRIGMSSPPNHVANLSLYSDGTNYEIRAGIFNDAGSLTSGSRYDITDAPHYIEFLLTRAATDISADGSIALYIDGALQGTVGSIDNYDVFAAMTFLRVGACLYGTQGSGTFYIDEILANNDGSAIGPIINLAVWRAGAGEGA